MHSRHVALQHVLYSMCVQHAERPQSRVAAAIEYLSADPMPSNSAQKLLGFCTALWAAKVTCPWAHIHGNMDPFSLQSSLAHSLTDPHYHATVEPMRTLGKSKLPPHFVTN